MDVGEDCAGGGVFDWNADAQCQYLPVVIRYVVDVCVCVWRSDRHGTTSE